MARRLRRAATPAEQRLWEALRRSEFKFRRQVPFGPYVVDLVCHRARVVVEVDGGVHRLDDVVLRDRERQAWIEGRGYKVVRVDSQDAFSAPETIAQRLIDACRAALTGEA